MTLPWFLASLLSLLLFSRNTSNPHEAITKFYISPSLGLRYVDDTFCIFNKDMSCGITRDNLLFTTICWKLTHTNRYLHYASVTSDFPPNISSLLPKLYSWGLTCTLRVKQSMWVKWCCVSHHAAIIKANKAVANFTNFQRVIWLKMKVTVFHRRNQYYVYKVERKRWMKTKDNDSCV